MTRFTRARAARWQARTGKIMADLAVLDIDTRAIAVSAKGGRLSRVQAARIELKIVQAALERLEESLAVVAREFDR